jgi:hypothetical protein
VLAPLELVAHNTLQLPPGCIPPPAAFFLVEQLLRGGPSMATLNLAVKLLRGCVSILPAPQQPQEPATEAAAGAAAAASAAGGVDDSNGGAAAAGPPGRLRRRLQGKRRKDAGQAQRQAAVKEDAAMPGEAAASTPVASMLAWSCQ